MKSCDGCAGPYHICHAFKQLGLSEEVVRGVQAAGYVQPTPIQLRAIPVILAGKDLIGAAQTGTGKTAAFALPILTLLKRTANAAASCWSRRGSWPRKWRPRSASTGASRI